MGINDPAGQVLLIEGDRGIGSDLRDILERAGHSVRAVGSLEEALALGSLPAVDVVVLDRRLSDGEAAASVPRLRSLSDSAAIVVVTGPSELQGAIEALRYGATDYLLVPVHPDALRVRIGRLVAQRKLIRSSARHESVFRNLVEADESMIVLLRPGDLAVLYFSPFAERLTGRPAAEVCGQSFAQLFIPDSDRAAHLAHVGQVRAGRSLRGCQCRIVCGDGSIREMLCNVRGIPDYDGSPALLIVGHDITELKAAQDRALQAERMAAIGQMCAGLAHESRNALQRSQACLEMLALRVHDNPQALNLIGRIQQSQDDLHRLYEDVREFAAPIRLVLQECRLDEIWRRAWSQLEPSRRDRNAILRDRFEGTDLRCLADPFRLGQVFQNILDNALAACEGPPIIQILSSPDRIGVRGAIRIAIRDNGPGLTPEQKGRIFEAFYTTKTRGTGLGMAIVKRILEAHGGRVDVGPGGPPGAEIILTLPRHPEE